MDYIVTGCHLLEDESKYAKIFLLSEFYTTSKKNLEVWILLLKELIKAWWMEWKKKYEKVKQKI